MHSIYFNFLTSIYDFRFLLSLSYLFTWLCLWCIMEWYALSAMAKICGGLSAFTQFRYFFEYCVKNDVMVIQLMIHWHFTMKNVEIKMLMIHSLLP